MSVYIYTASFGGSTPNTAGIPRQGIKWPEGKQASMPPPPPPKPELSLAYPLIPRTKGPATVA